MILEGKGGANDIQQAKKWLNRARVSGHPAASAVLGNVVFEEGQVVRGLAFMTTALERPRQPPTGLDPGVAGARLLAGWRSRSPHRGGAGTGYARQGPQLTAANQMCDSDPAIRIDQPGNGRG
jgi:TPR repeat protein